MTNENPKPREWWICLRWHQNGGSSVERVYFASRSKPALEANAGGSKIGQPIHVIEHSHHLAEVARLEEELNHTLAAASIHADEHRKARAEIERLEAENKKLQDCHPRNYVHKQLYDQVTGDLTEDRDRWHSCAVKLAEGLRFVADNEQTDHDIAVYGQAPIYEQAREALKHFDGMEGGDDEE